MSNANANATKPNKTARGLKIGELHDKPVYLTITGLKVGSKGKVHGVSAAYGQLNKGDARKIRKLLYKAGKIPLAASKRITDPVMM